uniref:RNA polymerase-associated protein LEO1 n=1 Tax=Attheya septentrionalis TaxID=420275 RepID=A0A7S2XRE6_9STRA|mmetsp:Transcript_29811/g.54590  ORF Transcript_29811/g.54590 Transcript_29811/m.54590 type:complete len:524 (+) Transcript_29811:124-1695(+)
MSDQEKDEETKQGAGGTTMKDLFADDSSDDSSVEDPNNQTMMVDDDDDNNNEEKEESKQLEIEYSENDEDVEFDDADAGITGASKPANGKSTGRSSSRSSNSSNNYNNNSNSNSNSNLYQTTLEEFQEDAEDGTGTASGAELLTRKPNVPKEPRRLEVLDMPRPEATRAHKTTLHMTKLPNLVGINPEPFDPDTFDADLEETEYRGNVHNMIRWRYKRSQDDGTMLRDPQTNKLQRESNSRFVRWSDGSVTLHVGNEVFEVDEHDSSTKNGFAGINGYLYLSQKAHTMGGGEGDNHDKTPAGTVLECMGPISSKMIPRPSSLKSEAHKNLTLAVRQRNMKKARIEEHVTQVDPEKEKLERIKNKDDLLKQEARGVSGRRGAGRRSGEYNNGNSNSNNRRPGMNRRYLESNEDENYDNIDIRQLKRRSQEDEYLDYGEDSGEDADSGDEAWENRKKAGFKKGSRRPVRGKDNNAATTTTATDDFDDDEEEAMFGDDSSDDEDNKISSSRGKKRNHNAVVDDDDD